MSIERGGKPEEVPGLEHLREVTDTLLTTALREPDNYSGFVVTTFTEDDYAEANFTRTLNPHTRSVFETFTIQRQGRDHTIIFKTQRPTREDEGFGGVVRVTKEYPLGTRQATTCKKEQGRAVKDDTLIDLTLLESTEGDPLDNGGPEQLKDIEALTESMRFIRGEYNEGKPRTRLGWLHWLFDNAR